MGLVLPWKQAFRPVCERLFPFGYLGEDPSGGLEHFMRCGPRLNKKITKLLICFA